MARPPFQFILLSAAAVILAAEPSLWLVRTWLDPVYGGHGLPVFLMVVALFSWSLSSPRRSQDPGVRRYALYLLFTTAVIRLFAQVLAVNTLGALALVVDIYALALLCGLRWRRRPLSPFWLAVVFSFSLPLERILQRTVGFGLQQISAEGACRTVGWLVDGVRCEGVQVLAAGQEISVDLPCSGARGLLQLLLLFSVLATLIRPGWARAFRGLLITLTAALAANILRISALILGQVFPLGISVMASPWHDLIGLAALALGGIPILLWAASGSSAPGNGPIAASDMTPHPYRPPSRVTTHAFGKTDPLNPKKSPAQTSANPNTRGPVSIRLIGIGAFLAALLIVCLPARPVDISRAVQTPQLPVVLRGIPGKEVPLTPLEKAYFTRYGGGAARQTYGAFGLLVVDTTAPLRHLHAPDECLRGAGHEVELIGNRRTGLPSALYRSTDPQGRQWQVAVSFFDRDGRTATSVAEVVWKWLQHPGATWRMVQRITPWTAAEGERRLWDRTVSRALDIPILPSIKGAKP